MCALKCFSQIISLTSGFCDLHKLRFYGNMQSILFINVDACSDNHNQDIRMHVHFYLGMLGDSMQNIVVLYSFSEMCKTCNAMFVDVNTSSL